MAGILSSSNIIKGGLPTITGILDKLVKIGLVEKTPLWRSKSRYHYKLNSPVVSIVYYLDQKYKTTEQNQTIDANTINTILGKEAETAIGELLAQYKNAIAGKTITQNGDIDVVLLDKKGKKATTGYEIKLGPISKKEAKTAIQRIRSNNINQAGLVSLNQKPTENETENYGAEELIKIAETIK
jgi:hypothetical protein